MNNLPEFITFTGVDEDTDAAGLVLLADDYPVEFGLLFSPKRQGLEPRYPKLSTIEWLTEELPLRWAAHLCGGDARDWLYEDRCEHDLRNFQRVQINTADPHIQPSVIGNQAAKRDVRAILQCRSDFPRVASVDVLFDASGGRGIVPSDWPEAANTTFCGYAGGLRPDNVAEAVRIIGTRATRYWIDMETGVRDKRDRFSLEKCRAVCEMVYGMPWRQPQQFSEERIYELAKQYFGGKGHDLIWATSPEYAAMCDMEKGARWIASAVRPEQTLALCRAMEAELRTASTASVCLLRNALDWARPYVESASTQMYDGTKGQGIREEAVRRLAIIDAALAGTPDGSEVAGTGSVAVQDLRVGRLHIFMADGRREASTTFNETGRDLPVGDHDLYLAAGAPASRVLDPADPYCPQCGHNRDASSVSSIDLGSGRSGCQLCGVQWLEVDADAGAAPEPIPERVYWAPLADNFYSAEGQGQGTDFYRKWKPRRAEFPQGESFGWGPGSAHNPFKDAPRTAGVEGKAK